MADIRIKDLTTLESASLTGDVFVIDGTTGTRKLSAFSPTFGGNVVVTGTLTTNGNVTINSNVGTIGKSGTGTGGNWRFVSDDGTSRWLSGLLGGSGETSYSIYDSVNSRSLLTATAAGVVQINQTTASTSTSTGALVVGGGLGVGGAIYAGNVINATVNGSASIIGRNGSASSFTSVAAYSGASDEIKGALTSSTAGVIIVGSQTNHPLAVYVNNAEVARWDTSANFQTRVTGTAPSLATNSTMTFELTSNTSLKIFVRGSDGTTRSTTLTLA